MKAKVKSLENIHKGIYFRDVSKFFNLFNTCKNILKFNFIKNNIENMKSITYKFFMSAYLLKYLIF